MKRALILLPLLVAGCGGRGELKPAADAGLPPAAYGASRQPEADELLTSPQEARPAIASELLKRSDPRESDRFDLPPN